MGVDQGLGHPQLVRRALGGEFDAVLLRALLGEEGARPGDVSRQDRLETGGRLVLPQGGRQLVHAHGGVGPQQHGQEAGALGRTGGHITPLGDHRHATSSRNSIPRLPESLPPEVRIRGPVTCLRSRTPGTA
ncbi:hypothetical protein ADK64_07095 [Streptomyces sp. MMG1121]|nr:hypothetical protein ADK64_07095 [Streptomyces sp. MMG1121]